MSLPVITPETIGSVTRASMGAEEVAAFTKRMADENPLLCLLANMFYEAGFEGMFGAMLTTAWLLWYQSEVDAMKEATRFGNL